MNSDQQKEIYSFWIEGAEDAMSTAKVLFENGKYASSLFFYHLALEKILKGLVVKNTGEHAPYEHNLLTLFDAAKIPRSNEMDELLSEVNTFNISGRYDDYKFSFNKKATYDYALRFMKRIEEKYIWLKNQ